MERRLRAMAAGVNVLGSGAPKRGSSRMRGLGAVVAVVLAAVILDTAPAAGATAYTWTGESTTTAGWSAAANWGGPAPTGGSPVELSFPHLTRAVCGESEPSQPCYVSENDLSGVQVDSMTLDDGDPYEMFGNPIALGSGGLIASPATGSSGFAGDLIELPIELTAQQSWSVADRSGAEIGENGVALLSKLTGAHPLTVNISNGAAVYLAADTNVGAVTIAGTKTTGLGVFNGYGALVESQLNTTDGEPVDLSHIFFIADGSTGPLSTTAAELAVGSGGYPTHELSAAGATFDAESEVGFDVSGANDTEGFDYSQLRSSGTVSLGGAKLSLDVSPSSEAEKTCPALTPGTQYTLISTTGDLSGEFGNAPEGGEIQIKFAKTCTQIHQLLKISYNRTGPTKTVVGTVVAGASSTTSLSAPASVTTNQPVALTATVTATEGAPAGTVEFLDNGAPVPGCASQSVSSGGTYTATCHTSFAVTSSPELLSARFSPGRGVNLTPSTSSAQVVTVGKDPTTISLTVSSSTPQVQEGLTYSAHLTPQDAGAAQPSGTIEFLDGSDPIGSCAAQPMPTPGLATCQVSYPSVGAHSITAHYTGDADFNGSTSLAVSVTVQQAAASSGTMPVPSMPSNVWLASRALVVKSNGWTSVKIGCEGIDACEGKLLLQITRATSKHRGHARRVRQVTIGEGSFSLDGSTNATVDFSLGKLALGMLKAHHGRLAARLVIARAKPASTQSITVHLIQKTSHSKGKHRRK